MDDEPDVSSLKRIGRILQVSSASIPAIAGAKYPGEHLHVNCVYDANAAVLTAKDALETCREDMAHALKLLCRVEPLLRYRSTVATFYYYFAGPTGVRQHYRLYRYAILREGLVSAPAEIDMTYMLTNGFFQESSERDDIQRLIEAERHYDPHFWVAGD